MVQNLFGTASIRQILGVFTLTLSLELKKKGVRVIVYDDSMMIRWDGIMVWAQDYRIFRKTRHAFFGFWGSWEGFSRIKRWSLLRVNSQGCSVTNCESPIVWGGGFHYDARRGNGHKSLFASACFRCSMNNTQKKDCHN